MKTDDDQDDYAVFVHLLATVLLQAAIDDVAAHPDDRTDLPVTADDDPDPIPITAPAPHQQRKAG